MSQQYVHGSTDAHEVARLEKQAAFVSPLTFPSLGLRPGWRVLDLATGVGAMGWRLLDQFPGISLCGLDLSATQLSAARRHHPQLTVLRGDATRMPFADATFDAVHCSWLLEHVPSPTAVLREVRRVLKPGGFCQFLEVDNSTFGHSPRSAAVDEVMRLLNGAQVSGGGDPFIGARLQAHFRDAGFQRFVLAHPSMLGDERNPAYFHSFVEEFSEIIEGLDESLGPTKHELIQRAVSDLRALPARGGSIRYTPVIATGWS